jgi:hypothetical protein
MKVMWASASLDAPEFRLGERRLSFAKTPQEPESHPCNMLRDPLYATHFKCVINLVEGRGWLRRQA